MNWLDRLLHRKPNRPAPVVEEAEKVQVTQFAEWGNVMDEVERVQKIAKGERQHPHRIRLHRP